LKKTFARHILFFLCMFLNGDLLSSSFYVDGSALSYGRFVVEKQSNENNYDSIHVDTYRYIFSPGLVFNANDLFWGSASFLYDSDVDKSLIFLDKINLRYQGPDVGMSLFVKDRFFDLDDPMRILDAESGNFNPPISFYQKGGSEDSKWGRNHYGLLFSALVAPLNQDTIIAGSTVDKRLLYQVVERTLLEFSIFKIGVSGIYKQYDFSLPDVNSSGWAQLPDEKWYQFDTNSFFKPEGRDWDGLIASDIGFNLWEKISIFAEGSYQMKTGGYFAKFVSTNGYLNESPMSELALHAGLQLIPIKSLMLEIRYGLNKGEADEYIPTAGKPDIITKKYELDHIRINLSVENSLLTLIMSGWFNKAKEGNWAALLDSYSLAGLFSVPETKQEIGARLDSTVTVGAFSIIPDFQFVSFIAEQMDVSTFLARLGAVWNPVDKLGLELRGWSKYYLFTEKPSGECFQDFFINVFGAITYSVSRDLQFSFEYGLSPRLDIDNSIGFDFMLQQAYAFGKNVSKRENLFNAERQLSTSHYITLSGRFKF